MTRKLPLQLSGCVHIFREGGSTNEEVSDELGDEVEVEVNDDPKYASVVTSSMEMLSPIKEDEIVQYQIIDHKATPGKPVYRYAMINIPLFFTTKKYGTQNFRKIMVCYNFG